MATFANTPLLSGYQTPTWPVQNRPQRALAALLAVLICLGLLPQLNRQSGGKWKRLVIDDTASVMTLQLIPVKPPIPTVPELALPKALTSTKPFVGARRPRPETNEASVVSESSTLTPTPVGIETTEPLSSLRFDREAIARAYKESKSEIQRMAEASGKDRIMETEPPSKSERYQASLERGYKPDCVSKSTGGAGLLAIPLIGYLIATDKCNFRK